MEEREHYTDLIVNSNDAKKLVVAGAGTGKSFTFKRVLSKVQSNNNLILTFINNLIRDLKNDLGAYAEVRTFHSFCRKILHEHCGDGINSKFEYYPDLIDLIAEDVTLLNGTIRSDIVQLIKKSFQLLEEDNNLTFFLERANYYNAVSFDDSVYRAIQVLNKNKEYIPSYDTIIIDEYQDFNALEAELLELLSTKCKNILIAGDDDQSVYSFKHATPEYIREKYKDPKFTNFELPYCSRCCKVIVDAVHNVINYASDKNLLPDRISKIYTYHTQSKDNDSQKYPLIQKANVSVNRKTSPFFARYIVSILEKLDEEEINEAKENNYPLALIIGPSHYLRQIEESLKSLTKNYCIQNTTNKESKFPLISAVAHLYKNIQSNLGWRIILQENCDKNLLNNILHKTKDKKYPIIDCLPTDFKNLWLEILEKLKKEFEDKNFSSETPSLIEKLGENYMSKFTSSLQRDELSGLGDSMETEILNKPNLSEIKLTTYSGSKGLSGGQVFIVGLEEEEFPRQNPTFDEICQFIVSLTRTRKQCHLMTVNNFSGKWKKESQFIKWIDSKNLNNINVNKDYFKQFK
ncbi:hypothetical protein B1207_01070 [Legionella quinlivanii]|uniref:DNA 3'-5' helicase II n=1 Tax=Legionella quinlivanii TaxID=45073 RepID=A0A364LNE7_9GAMM|nr:ATP-dependent helicase [Legionella quinlivanii]RAP38508.1 hypothetical protein B1207_01070 [Legionella quinlivanii]